MNESKYDEKRLQKALAIFKDYSKDTRFQEDTQEREERKSFFRQIIREKFSEFTFSEMIKKLWASQIWGNKDYLITKIIKNNGLAKLEQAMHRLVVTKGTPGDRYEQFLNKIRDMGPSMVTEILCYLDSDDAGIWNAKARTALAWLRVDNIPYEKYKITGKEYDKYNKTLKELSRVLIKDGYQNVDLLFVDYFFWEIQDKLATQESLERQVSKKEGVTISKHNELRDKIAAIGSWLGFEVETEKLIAPGARIDVIWRARIANLGAVSYIFEVQDRGSIDSLLLNLQKAQVNPTVQKLIIVSSGDQLKKIEKETQTLPENFRRAVTLWESIEVENTYQNLDRVTTAIAKLHLTRE